MRRAARYKAIVQRAEATTFARAAEIVAPGRPYTYALLCPTCNRGRSSAAHRAHRAAELRAARQGLPAGRPEAADVEALLV